MPHRAYSRGGHRRSFRRATAAHIVDKEIKWRHGLTIHPQLLATTLWSSRVAVAFKGSLLENRDCSAAKCTTDCFLTQLDLGNITLEITPYRHRWTASDTPIAEAEVHYGF